MKVWVLSVGVVAAVLTLLTMTGNIGASEQTRSLNGEFVWESGEAVGDLEAVFASTGEDRWEVSFHFNFRGRPHTYSGTAIGSLDEGSLAGEVRNENKRRVFSFRGAVKGGAFAGTHAETTGGGENATGTLTLG